MGLLPAGANHLFIFGLIRLDHPAAHVRSWNGEAEVRAAGPLRHRAEVEEPRVLPHDTAGCGSRRAWILKS